MAVIEGGVSGALAGVDVEAAKPLHTTPKPLPYGSLGHYRCSSRTRLVPTQAAASRLFELRNAHASNLMVIGAIHVRWLQGPLDTHTATIEDSLDVYKATGFTVVDPTGSPVTPLITKLRTTMANSSAAAAANALAGLAAGITGGTLTLEASPFVQLPNFLLAAPVATAVPPPAVDLLWDPGVDQTDHPLVLAPNEGIVIANRVLLGAAAGSSVYVDVQWAEVASY
jgi:hypothetical protein